MLMGASPEHTAFANPVHETQATFRVALEAMSRPGRVGTVPCLPDAPPGMAAGTAALLLTLLDLETALWLDDPAADSPTIAPYLRFHCGCPLAIDGAEARFALVLDGTSLPDLDSFSIGIPEFPERSTTLIIQVSDIREGGPLTLSGPGIDTTHSLTVKGLSDQFWPQFDANRVLFPLGIDVFLVAGERIVGLPRTVTISREPTAEGTTCMSR